MRYPSLDAFAADLQSLQREGYIQTHRAGDTGVGKTLEDRLGIPENNDAEADIHVANNPVELKSIREHATNRITLFTKEPPKAYQHVWNTDLINHTGYLDQQNRDALKVTVKYGTPNEQGLSLGSRRNQLTVTHTNLGICGAYPRQTLRRAFEQKFPSLALVTATTRGDGATEFLWYKTATLLTGFSADEFFSHVKTGDIVLDFRMHLRDDGTLRNHGTAWRATAPVLEDLFDEATELTAGDVPADQLTSTGQTFLTDY